MSKFIHNGLRSEPASEMLKPAAQRNNLDVLTNAQVTRVRNPLNAVFSTQEKKSEFVFLWKCRLNNRHARPEHHEGALLHAANKRFCNFLKTYAFFACEPAVPSVKHKKKIDWTESKITIENWFHLVSLTAKIPFLSCWCLTLYGRKMFAQTDCLANFRTLWGFFFRFYLKAREQLELNMWRVVDSKLCQPGRKSSCQLVLLVLLTSSCCLALAPRNICRNSE